MFSRLSWLFDTFVSLSRPHELITLMSSLRTTFSADRNQGVDAC